MGRPRKDEADRVIHASLPTPHDLTPAQRSVWARDIATMPLGFFVPADTAALRTYVDVVVEYESIHRAMLSAKGQERRDLSKDFRAMTAQRLSCMRALRLLPHSRLHKSQAATLANEPTFPEGAEDLPANERWRLLFPPQDRST